MGEGGVKNPEKIADVVYGWSLYVKFMKKMVDSSQLILSLFVHLVVGTT